MINYEIEFKEINSFIQARVKHNGAAVITAIGRTKKHAKRNIKKMALKQLGFCGSDTDKEIVDIYKIVAYN